MRYFHRQTIFFRFLAMSKRMDDVQKQKDEKEPDRIMAIDVTWQKAINFAIFFGLLFVTGLETYKCFDRLMKSPTYTSFRLAAQKEVDFPSLTFCPIVTEALKEDKLTVIV